MGYRGQDLDLRTPQTWRDAPSEPSDAVKGLSNGPARGRSSSGAEEIPIWVDDTVLACCNHAFDVALAHRSSEVRVEHLLHALTRIEDAAEILETNGVRAASLRRETATVIAGEIPVSLSNGSGAPRRADSFEEVLRVASAHSYQRNQPVSVEDLLHVFLDLRPAIRGLELIERHLVGRRRERPERSMPSFRRPPAQTYAPPPVETRFEQQRERERVRRPAGRFYAPDVDYAPPPAPVGEPMHAATDHMQNSRLEALEQMVRTISGQIAGQRDETARYSGGVFDRLQALEAIMSSRPEARAVNIDQLLRRLNELEELLKARTPQSLDLTPVMERMTAFEHRLSEPAAVSAAIDFGPVVQRLADIEHRLGEAAPVSATVDLDPVVQRLAEIERRLNEPAPVSAAIDFGPVEQRLTDFEAQVARGLADLDRKSDVGEISGRLTVIEEALLGRDGEVSGDIDSRMRDVAEAVSLQQATLEDARSSLAADVRDVNASLAEQATRISHTGEGLTELVRAVESLRNEERNTVSQVASLLSTYRTEIQEFVTQSRQTHDAHNSELKEVHEALVKLNQNQHTLAGSFDEWRNDDAGDLSVIATRIEGLEKQTARPLQLLEGMSVNLDNVNRFTVERYHRRNRFWYWLFGTDDWVAASWPSQAKRIEDERAALRRA